MTDKERKKERSSEGVVETEVDGGSQLYPENGISVSMVRPGSALEEEEENGRVKRPRTEGREANRQRAKAMAADLCCTEQRIGQESLSERQMLWRLRRLVYVISTTKVLCVLAL